MIKRYCDRCGQQIDEGVHAWYVLELHGTDGEFRHKELCEECYEYLCEKDEVPTADRKTENCSEKPNNCEDFFREPTAEERKAAADYIDSISVPTGVNVFDLMDEPTISKMEQVETMSCAECKHRPIGAEICEEPCHYEPQTDWHYDEQDATWYPYKHEDEPQQKSCATCKHALGNWDGESNNCGRCCGADRRFYEPKDEPQTERSE